MSTSSLLNTGIIVLVNAVKNAFPNSKWAHAGTRGDIFFCDFYLQKPLHEKISLEVVGQTLRSFLEQLDTISSKEMLLGNAIDYLKHYKGEWPEYIEEDSPQNLIHIIELNGKSFFSTGPAVSSLEELQDCRLADVQALPCEVSAYPDFIAVRFTAYAVSNKADLSPLKKRLQQIKKDNPTEKGASLKLFIPPQDDHQRWIWLSKGIHLRNLLVSFALSQFHAEFIQGISLDSQEDNTEVLQQNLITFFASTEKKHTFPQTFFQKIELSQAPTPFSSTLELFDSPTQTQLTGHIFCSEEKVRGELISSLQIIEKTYKMFGVECYWALRMAKPRKHRDKADWKKMQQCMQQAIDDCGYSCESLPSEDEQLGPQAELVVNDSYGYPWTLARITAYAGYPPLDDNLVKCLQNGNPTMVAIQVNALESLERLITVLLERHKEQLFERLPSK